MNKELDFTSFKTLGKRIILELPTQTAGGLIYMTDDKALDSGWFKVVSVGDTVGIDPSFPDKYKIKPGDEVFVYFPNEPLKFDEIVFKSRKEQAKEVESEKFAKKIEVNLGGTKDNIIKAPVIDRKFCEVNEYDVRFVRAWENERIK